MTAFALMLALAVEAQGRQDYDPSVVEIYDVTRDPDELMNWSTSNYRSGRHRAHGERRG